MLRALVLVSVLVLAGCQAPGAPVTTEPGSTAGDSPATTDGTPTASPDSNGTSGERPASGAVPDDPESDRLGWEGSYWHNESIAVTSDDGLNESELDAVVSRSMARMELVRQLEFEQQVPVRVINRSTYQGQSGGNHSAQFQRFDNAKFEALFLVGERNDSVSVQESTRGQSVLGYYSPDRDAIVVVSDSSTPRLDGEGTLAHELVHALQDQHFDIANSSARTRDGYQGRNGLIEGDASFAQQRYQARCGNQWRCLAPNRSGEGGAAGTSGGSPGHLGIQFMMYFPYSDGPGFVQSLYEDGGWETVNDAYSEVPDGSPEVIYPERYSEWEPATVDLRDRSSGEWERLTPEDRPNYTALGQSAIAATLAYTLFDDYNRDAVVRPGDVINYRSDGNVSPRDPFNYDVPAAAGWTGGKMYVYGNGDESGYVWKTKWQNASEASEFADTWRGVIRHWGGERVGENEWVVRDSEFADAFAVRQNGNTVTIVNAPERADLSAVHDV